MKNQIPYIASKDFTYKPLKYWCYLVLFIAIFLKIFILEKENFMSLSIITLNTIWLSLIAYSIYVQYKGVHIRNYISEKYYNGEAIFSPIEYYKIIHKNKYKDPIIKQAKYNGKRYTWFILKIFISLPFIFIIINMP